MSLMRLNIPLAIQRMVGRVQYVVALTAGHFSNKTKKTSEEIKMKPTDLTAAFSNKPHSSEAINCRSWKNVRSKLATFGWPMELPMQRIPDPSESGLSQIIVTNPQRFSKKEN